MRRRGSERWLSAILGTLVMLAAFAVVHSTLTLDGASSAWAATEDELDEPAPPPEKSTSTKSTSTKSAPAKADDESEKADAKGSGGKDDGEKKGKAKKKSSKGDADKKSDKKGSDKASSDKIIPAKSSSDKIGSDDPGVKESFLVWLYKSLGTRYVIIFLIITFNAVSLITMIVLGMRRCNLCPDDLAAEFEAKLNEKQYQEAYELVKKDTSLLGRVLKAGMGKLSEGYEAATEAMQEVGELRNMKLEQRNGYIALIAQLGPMFGLLGTVDGMVMAFDVIAHSNVTPKPSELAQGIGTALVTTVVGLWISIPSIVFYHMIRNRLSRYILEVGTMSGNLMKRFATIQVTIKKT